MTLKRPTAAWGSEWSVKKRGYLPPCRRDTNAFGEEQFFIRHDDPLEGRGLPSTEEEIPFRSWACHTLCVQSTVAYILLYSNP
jgi:exodeoxyribonuclease V alpha subunit